MKFGNSITLVYKKEAAEDEIYQPSIHINKFHIMAVSMTIYLQFTGLGTITQRVAHLLTE